MNHGLDDLTDLLDGWGDAAGDVIPDLTDVRRRAHRRQLGTRAGAAAAVAVVGGLAATAIATRGSDGQRLGTDGPASAGADQPLVRELRDGHELRVTPLPRTSVFGPFGPDRRWTPPAGCGPTAAVDLRFRGEPNGDRSGWSQTLVSLDRSTRTTVRGLVWSVVDGPPRTEVDAVVSILDDAVPGDRYRLVDAAGTVLDEAVADRPLVALVAPLPGVADDAPLPALRVEHRDADSRTIGDAPLPPPRDSSDCVSPPEPTEVGPLSAVDSPDPDDVAIRAAIDTSIRTLEVDARTTPEIHRDGDSAWVRIPPVFRPVEDRPPRATLGGWLELHRDGDGWQVTRESWCAYAEALTGSACPTGN